MEHAKFAFEMAQTWEEELDFEVRRHVIEVYGELDKLKGDEHAQLCADLIASSPETYINRPEKGPLVELIGTTPGQCIAWSERREWIFQRMHRYRTSLLKTLNIFEAVAVVRKAARENKEQDFLDIIDKQFFNYIKMRTAKLSVFIDEWNKWAHGGKPGGFQILLKEIKE